MLKRLGRSRTVQILAGELIALYLRFVSLTSRYVFAPDYPALKARAGEHWPVIIAMWHGEHFMMPFVNRPKWPIAALISLHRDGEINTRAAHRLGIMTVRGSGDHGGRFMQKRAVAAFRDMIKVLEDGTAMALTADVPKVSRKAGIGIIQLARMSGRPIFPTAITTSRHIRLDTWDKSVINLPFSRIAIAQGDPIFVPADSDGNELEAFRQQLEAAQNEITERAYALARGDAEAA